MVLAAVNFLSYLLFGPTFLTPFRLIPYYVGAETRDKEGNNKELVGERSDLYIGWTIPDYLFLSLFPTPPNTHTKG